MKGAFALLSDRARQSPICHGFVRLRSGYGELLLRRVAGIRAAYEDFDLHRCFNCGAVIDLSGKFLTDEAKHQ